MPNPLLEHYVKLTEFLGYTLGPSYEVALHDLTNTSHSIIAIANNHVSGRKVGAPLSSVGLQALMDKSYESTDYKLHYRGISANGKLLRSSTLFIKSDGEIIGMLCINFDDSRYRQIGDELLSLCHPDTFFKTSFHSESETPSEAPQERFYSSIDGAAAQSVGQALESMGLTADRLTPEERMHIIGSLEEGGIFLLKGAVKDVAEALSCSQASVYRYLSQVKKDEEDGI